MAGPLPVLVPPIAWTNQPIVLYHGTVNLFAPAILARVDITRGKPNTDFGPGFYTTTVLLQAHSWAAQIAVTLGANAAVIEFTVSREELAELQTLAFVRGNRDAEDYCSFVHYCRRGATNHNRPDGKSDYYDVVYGPVSAAWNQRLIFADADQISFHTKAAEKVLNRAARRRII